MKNINKILLAALSVLVMFSACTKEETLLYYSPGKFPSLVVEDTSIVGGSGSADWYVLNLKWNNPGMGTDFKNVKFVSEIDLVNGDFSQPLTSTVLGSLKDSVQSKTINSFLLSKGFGFAQWVNLKVRTVASYSNNNDRKISNVVTFSYRTYKVPPVVQLPSSGRLYIVGSATVGSWGNPVPIPSQEFDRLSETSFGGVFKLNGGGQYLGLPVNGSWDNKYSVAKNNLPGLAEGGDFGYNLPDNFPGPAADGWYRITFDFQAGKFKVENVSNTPVPDSLYGIGDGTLAGWDNSNGNTQLKRQFLKRLNATTFQGTLTLEAGKSLKFISKVSQWQPQFGRGDAAGKLGYNYGGGNDPGTISVPASGAYTVLVDFYTMTYTLTKQ